GLASARARKASVSSALATERWRIRRAASTTVTSIRAASRASLAPPAQPARVRTRSESAVTARRLMAVSPRGNDAEIEYGLRHHAFPTDRPQASPRSRSREL